MIEVLKSDVRRTAEKAVCDIQAERSARMVRCLLRNEYFFRNSAPSWHLRMLDDVCCDVFGWHGKGV